MQSESKMWCCFHEKWWHRECTRKMKMAMKFVVVYFVIHFNVVVMQPNLRNKLLVGKQVERIMRAGESRKRWLYKWIFYKFAFILRTKRAGYISMQFYIKSICIYLHLLPNNRVFMLGGVFIHIGNFFSRIRKLPTEESDNIKSIRILHMYV